MPGKYKLKLSAIGDVIFRQLSPMTSRELCAYRTYCKKDKRGSWWVSARLAPIVTEAIDNILYTRKKTKNPNWGRDKSD